MGKDWVKFAQHLLEQQEGIHEMVQLLALEQPTEIQLGVFVQLNSHLPISETEAEPSNL